MAEDARKEMEEGRWLSGAGFKHGVFTFTHTDRLITHTAFIIHTGDYSIDNTGEKTGRKSFKKAVGSCAQRAAEAGVVGQRCITRL